MEAEAEASTELAEEYSGDTLAHKFGKLEAGMEADDDLAALKAKMGLAAPAAPPEDASPVRVEEQADAPAAEVPVLSAEEHDELAAALAELEAQEQAEQARMKR